MDQAAGLRHIQYKRHRLDALRKKRKVEHPTRVIAISSGKGGVGKTFATVNLSVMLARMGKRVLILDGDLGLANVDLMVGLKPLWNLSHVISGERSLSDVIIEAGSGVHIIPGGSGIEKLVSLDYGERLSLLEAIEESAFNYDYLIIDTPSGIGADVMFFNQAAHQVICVISPDVTSLTDTYALLKLLRRRHGEVAVKILVNFVGRTIKSASVEAHEIFTRLSSVVDRFLHIKISCVGYVPADELVREALEEQRPLVERFPHSDSCRCLTKIAKRIDEEFKSVPLKGGVQFFFNRLLESK
jgi:flagellar biosynthesis protein FlhG